MDLKAAVAKLDAARAKCDEARRMIDALATGLGGLPWAGGYIQLVRDAVDGIDRIVDVADDTADKLAGETPATPA